MIKRNKSYSIESNFPLFLMAILLATIVLSTITDYSEITENLTHIVDCDEDGETEESELKNLSIANLNEDLALLDVGLTFIFASNNIMEARYDKTPTPPPEQ